jgi:hypothetical protein
MELRARIRPLTHRAAFTAASVALLASAVAGAAASPAHAAAKKRAPVISSVAPKDVAVGEQLTIRGKHFVPGRSRNTVVFKRDGARAVFAKAEVGTKKMLRIKVPASLQEFFALDAGNPVPTRFRLRVLARKFGKKFTSVAQSPVVSAPRPPKVETPTVALPDGDCDGDGAKNRADGDDDNDGLADDIELSLSLDPCVADTDKDGVLDKWEFDCDRNGVLNRDQADDDSDLLSDEEETRIGTDPCNPDTDGDKVEDGYEYRSAKDLNDDEYQTPNQYLAHPYKVDYPNAGFADANVDYDGDSLTLKEEYDLWVYTYSVTKTDPRSLDALSYSDGEQYSRSRRVSGGQHDGRREPTLGRVSYDKHQQFLSWVNDPANGYNPVWLEQGSPWWNHGVVRQPFDVRDFNRSSAVSASAGVIPLEGTFWRSEQFYFDLDDDTFLSDHERDEDADGLTNYDETHGRMRAAYWATCYDKEMPFHITYEGTSPVDADSDGDGVLDGADDQDHDDIPNVMELSRNAASGYDDTDPAKGECSVGPGAVLHAGDYGRVNPFNPCLPARWSRTCPKVIDAKTGAPFDGSPNWYSLN